MKTGLCHFIPNFTSEIERLPQFNWIAYQLALRQLLLSYSKMIPPVLVIPASIRARVFVNRIQSIFDVGIVGHADEKHDQRDRREYYGRDHDRTTVLLGEADDDEHPCYNKHYGSDPELDHPTRAIILHVNDLPGVFIYGKTLRE